jgi:hypothetical protein
MHLSIEQVTALAPDSGSVAAGKKLMGLKSWPELGRSDGALWGKCQGSAVYQVRVDLANMGYSCSCPSRKFPCKHVLGLMMLAASSLDAVAVGPVPEWVDEWLAKRRARDEKKADEATKPAKPVDEKAQQRRAEQRESRVQEGLERLDLWMKDLVRTGLAAVEGKPAAFWDEQAKRLVDAQAPGLASRIARLATIPGAGRDWPERLVSELGRTSLLLRAWERIGELDPALQSDVRQAIGWNVSQTELEAAGEPVQDVWAVIGQWTDDDGRLRTQRSWVVGRESGRMALVLQFAAGPQPFGESIVAGSEQRATLVFHPGAAGQRARFGAREGEVKAVTERLPGCDAIELFLEGASEALARNPWLSAFGCVLRDVTLAPGDDAWHVVDSTGKALPLQGRAHWTSLAITGGQRFDLTGEWDGQRLRPLGLMVEGQYRLA